ncbi:MAG: adenosylhomocysteinase [Candidatus Diapherotrites archaeon]|nr:adenosylhomocysteinase [Candidatus Diapherotrites archaeon]
MSNYEVKDIKLAEQGKKKIELAEADMGALLKVREYFEKTKPFKGEKIGLALHITKETAVLVRTLKAGGAQVAITGCNPLSTQDDVAAALAKEEFHVYGHKGENTKDYYEYLNKILDFKPTITVDDGCDLVTEIHTKRTELLDNVKLGLEETTTGIIRLKAMEKDNALKYPIIAVNDNLTKHLMDNYYGTGQSTLDGVLRATNLMLAGKTVVVAGYGSCGKGVALRAKGAGAKVIVTEVNPFRALQAYMDGNYVMTMNEAASIGDLFITVTGDCKVITAEHVQKMKSNAVICNSGHFDIEIDLKEIEKRFGKGTEMRPFLKQYKIRNKKINILADGRLVNLASAEGHPSVVMSLSFCGQALGAEWGLKHAKEPIVYHLPETVDEKISKLQLQHLELKIDKLTPEQEHYLSSWKIGT